MTDEGDGVPRGGALPSRLSAIRPVQPRMSRTRGPRPGDGRRRGLIFLKTKNRLFRAADFFVVLFLTARLTCFLSVVK
jgi:hypothetical protein